MIENSIRDKILTILKNFQLNPKTKKILWADISTHKLSVIDLQTKHCEKTYLFSSSRAPQSCQWNSFGTPWGLHAICEKIGEKVPLYGVFQKRCFINKICSPATNKLEKALITTRILRLQGLEEGVNQGERYYCDTYRRCVYIHGTNLEAFIPQPLSHGCLLLSNPDIVELFNLANVHDYVYITPPNT